MILFKINNFKKYNKMRYILEIPENKVVFAEEFFKNVSFIKKVKAISSNEITNNAILQSIEQYETGKVNPTILNLSDLKSLINA